MATPAYDDDKSQVAPPYVESPFLPPQTDTKYASQTIWIQSTDITGLYRKRYILPANPPSHLGQTPEPDNAPPPTYTPISAPLYTVKSHGQQPSPKFHTKNPDFTIYVGDGDSGPAVAVGNVNTYQPQKSVGEVRFFLHSSTGEGSSSSGERPNVVVKTAGKKHLFTLGGQELEWEETGVGEEAPPPPPPPEPVSQPAPPKGFLAKLRRKASAKPPPATNILAPRKTKTMVLTSQDPKTGVRTKIATYVELQPIGDAKYMYLALTPQYKDGHTAKMEIHDPFFTFSGASSNAAMDLAVVTMVLLLEAHWKNIEIAANRGWTSAMVASYGGFGAFSGN